MVWNVLWSWLAPERDLGFIVLPKLFRKEQETSLRAFWRCCLAVFVRRRQHEVCESETKSEGFPLWKTGNWKTIFLVTPSESFNSHCWQAKCKTNLVSFPTCTGIFRGWRGGRLWAVRGRARPGKPLTETEALAGPSPSPSCCVDTHCCLAGNSTPETAPFAPLPLPWFITRITPKNGS